MEEKNRIKGKKSRAAGQRFENKVRKDLESKGWICDKWSNQVDLENNKLVPSKHKFRGVGIPMAMGTGFPDFVCFHLQIKIHDVSPVGYNVIGVECKSNGYLDKIEKEKCKWYKDNKIFSEILIASKSKERGEINYKEFKDAAN